MFLQNKYTNWYFSIINKAKIQNRRKTKDSYFEKHHIIPKSCGGNNELNNLILLTPREHFICHMLLIKMIIDDKYRTKMVYVLDYMSRKGSTCKGFQSKHYAYIKSLNSKTRQVSMRGEGNPFFGKTHSEELKRNFSINNPTQKPEVREKMRKSKNCSNRHVPCSLEKKAKISASLLGRLISEETRAKQRRAKQNLIWINNPPNKPKQIKISDWPKYPDWKRGRGFWINVR